MRRRYNLVAASSVLAVCFLVGCGEEGPQRLQLRGRVTDAGEPLHVEGRDVGLGMVVVEFYPVDAEDNPTAEPIETAHVSESGEFNLVDGIPPGRYQIAVRQWDPYPNVDRLEGRFSRERSEIVRDLTSEDDVLEIDVSRPEG